MAGALKRGLRDRRFDRSVARAAQEGVAIAAGVRARMLTAYKNNALRFRGETIARTEAFAALGEAQEQAFRQAIDKGIVDPEAVVGDDARTLRQRHMKIDPITKRIMFDRTGEGREKTGVATIGTMSRFGDWLLRRYLHLDCAERIKDALLFLMREGGKYGESTLARDFRRIMDRFDAADDRQLRDLRRSGIMEAFTGDADGRKVSEKFGNSIDRSNRLFKTYNPVDLAKVRAADSARVEGRKRRRRENEG